MPKPFKKALKRQQGLDAWKILEQWHPVYTSTMMALTVNSDELAAKIKKTPEESVNLIEDLGRYLAWRKTEQELLESAQARLLVIGEEVADDIDSSNVVLFRETHTRTVG